MPPLEIRMPAVAGRFYPSNPQRLAREIDEYLAPIPAVPAPAALACVVPHAGYMYSGRVAGAVYRALPVCVSVVVVGPNHFGKGSQLAVDSAAAWRTPLGDALIHRDLAAAILRHCPELTEDAFAHAAEHSLEVQIPFLQRRMGDFRFVPIAIGAASYEQLAELGHGLASTLREHPDPTLIIASSDMNHYEPDAVTRAKDAKAIDRITALDARGLWDVVEQESISMCGVGPAVVALTAARDLGAASAVLEKYATSADAGGPPESVVGYAGMIVPTGEPR